MTPAASTSALEPCVPESFAPRSGAEASRALERRPNPQELSPKRQHVAREKCPWCNGRGGQVSDIEYKSWSECSRCEGTGLRIAERGSEQGSNTKVTGDGAEPRRSV